MKTIKLEDYVTEKVEKSKLVGTGVSISIQQQEFIRRKGINLSSLVRDVLNKLMQEDKEKKQNEAS